MLASESGSLAAMQWLRCVSATLLLEALQRGQRFTEAQCQARAEDELRNLAPACAEDLRNFYCEKVAAATAPQYTGLGRPRWPELADTDCAEPKEGIGEAVCAKGRTALPSLG